MPASSAPIAWMNGRFLPAAELSLPVGDAGFVLGATVTEQLRTFRGRLFRPHAHSKRLHESLVITGIDLAQVRNTSGQLLALRIEDVLQAAAEVASTNAALGPAEGDLGVVIFATPGDLASQHQGHSGSPRVVVHSFPLAFGLWHTAYEQGVALRRVQVRQVPDVCWPVQLKCRSRMHYFLADREAADREPGSRAVLEELDGTICETSTANVLVVHEGVLSAPTHALEGVSLAYVQERAAELHLPWQPKRLVAADLASADEIILTSTPNCLLPATRFEGVAVGTGKPGPIYRSLLASWSEQVGVDIAAQAAAMA